MRASGWIFVVGCAVHAPAIGATDPRLILYDGPDGATCSHLNAGAKIRWRHPMGDWRDAHGASQGNVPFSTVVLARQSTPKVARWDVTELVRGWLDGTFPNFGLLLRPVADTFGAHASFHSREARAASDAPRLIVNLADIQPPAIVIPSADVWLDCTTAYALGERDELRVGPHSFSALHFDMDKLVGHPITNATLELVPADDRATGTYGVFRLDPAFPTAIQARETGIAAAHPGDVGIGTDPDVVMASGFDSPSPLNDWSQIDAKSHADVVGRDDSRGFVPFQGNALRVLIAKGENLGLNMTFDFMEKIGYEPEEIYFRYYLRLADDWKPTVDGGKLPGLSGTYGKVGWGGRKADARKGWSLRGAFYASPTLGNPLHDRSVIGTYAYHADMAGHFGDGWEWMNAGLGLLFRNRWYCIEQYFKLNTPRINDGVFRGWIDDQLAFEKRDVRVRDLSSLKIQRVWMNVYFGGVAPTPEDMHLYIDNVVIARRKIGCV
jgi:hypothetical protein